MKNSKGKYLWVRDVGRATSCNLGLPAGGIRRPQLRRLTYWGRRSCGNPWSLADMVAAYDHPPSMAGEVKISIKYLKRQKFLNRILLNTIEEGGTPWQRQSRCA